MTDNDKPLILLDGSSFLYRAFYASKSGFTTKSGLPTGATLIITRMLQNLIEKYHGSKMIAVFDAKGKSFRSEVYPEYKSNRPPMPEELKVQIDYVRRIVNALGLPLVSISGVEADDVLGSYAKLATEEGLDTVICTGDKDLAQLVNDHVVLYDSMNETYYDREAVIKKYGVPPERIIDFLAIKGDTSDNIPGMAGAGDKTAIALLNGLGGIEDIYARRDEIEKLDFRGAKKFASKYEEAIDIIRLSYRLATIKTDVELPFLPKDAKVPEKNVEELLALYKELEFVRFYNQLADEAGVQERLSAGESGGKHKASKASEAALETVSEAAGENQETGPAQNYKTYGSTFKLITSREDLKAASEAILKAGLVAVDTETSSLDTRSCTLVGISLSIGEKQAWYIPLSHTYIGVTAQLTFGDIKEILMPTLNSDAVDVIGHNIKFDMLVLHYAGLELSKASADTMVMAHLLDSAQPVNLDALCLKYLNYQNVTYEEVTQGKKKLNFSEVTVEEACIYSGEDSEVTFRLYAKLKECLEKKPDLNRLLASMEMPLLHTLYKMEINGVYVDAAVLASQNKTLSTELARLKQDIFVACGEEFNISSPKQLGIVLFEKLAIPYPKKKKAGSTSSYSTAEDILQMIAEKYDVANLILRYRELSKLITTYTEKLQTIISPETGRIYASFNQAGTVTGRLSSSDPNLQNIPARTKEGKLIRDAFIAPDGYSIISADYSQIELRLIAHIAEDAGLLKAFNAGYDIHRATAAEILGKPIDEISDQERSRAKATNFGLMYGMGAFGLKKQTNMSMEEAKHYIDRFFERYPNVRDYMESVKKEAHKYGYVKTIEGREITVTNINSSLPMSQRAAERAAVNAPMQGSAADIIKLAMNRIQEWIETLPENTVRMTIQVHDELVFEVKNEFIEEATINIKNIMENVVKLKVPLTVGISAAANWGSAH